MEAWWMNSNSVHCMNADDVRVLTDESQAPIATTPIHKHPSPCSIHMPTPTCRSDPPSLLQLHPHPCLQPSPYLQRLHDGGTFGYVVSG